jgi:16S rRNA (uracil1498-N3)-methyltransferase
MRQFLLPPGYAGQDRIRLEADDAHYLVRVLRLREGDSVPALDAGGARFVLSILRTGAGWCEAAVAPVRDPPSFSGLAPDVTLLQCLPKGSKMDSIVRQATEEGVARIVPLLSERTIPQGTGQAGRLERWQRIAREALQQSGNSRLPLMEKPRPLASIRGGEEWGTALVFHEAPVGGQSLHGLLADSARRVSVLIGPEGGLSAAEIAFLQGEGFRPVWLGSAVLRVDTAAIAAVALVKQILWERSEWRTTRSQ